MGGAEAAAVCGCLPVDPDWQPNLTWLTDDLAVGGSFPAERMLHLAEAAGIGAAIDLRSEDRDDEAHLAAHGVAFLHLPTDDHGALSAAALRGGVGFARERMREARRLLVHCEHGIGRSVTLALCILVDRGMNPMQALRLSKDRRAVASPSPAQYEGWSCWLRGRPEARDGTWSVPDFEAFKRVAYSHLRAP